MKALGTGAVFKSTEQQKHGAQSEVFQRSVSPMGFLSRSAPTTFRNDQSIRNEDRMTAAHASHPVGAGDRSGTSVSDSLGNKALTAAGRKHIAPKNFALPGGRYPIQDAAHARNALARGAQHASPAELSRIKAKVHAKFPGIGG